MDVKALMWGSHLLLVLSDGHDLPPSFGTDSLSANSQLKCIFAFLCSCAIFSRQHFDVFKGMCTPHLMSYRNRKHRPNFCTQQVGTPCKTFELVSKDQGGVGAYIMVSVLQKCCQETCFLHDLRCGYPHSCAELFRPLMLYQPRNPTDCLFCQPWDSYLWNMDVFGAAAGSHT